VTKPILLVASAIGLAGNVLGTEMSIVSSSATRPKALYASQKRNGI
jgi:hypothetical protein